MKTLLSLHEDQVTKDFEMPLMPPDFVREVEKIIDPQFEGSAPNGVLIPFIGPWSNFYKNLN